MTARRFSMICLVASLLPALAAGCLERKEKITVDPDGAVTIRLKYEGSPKDLDSRDAMPAAASGWETTRTLIEKKGDDEKYQLYAKRKFAPSQPLPESFAAPDDPDADLKLRFPTTLTIEHRPDGAYYHFRRTYLPRTWATVRYWHDLHINDDIEKLGEKPAEELTHAERVKILKAFANTVGHEQVEYARAAWEEVDRGLPPDCWLLARAALLGVYAELDYDEMVARYQAMPEEQRDQEFEKESDALIARAYAALSGSLQVDAGFDAARLAAFETAFARQKLGYEITDELGLHSFKIKIKMPGEVVAHNAHHWHSEDVGYLVWEFKGDAFRDRPHELMVTSRVPVAAAADGRN